ncbi:ABC-2 family transporter protein [Proteiniborus sp. MB09-C3]|uniref:ABC transporter permease n=1 Tax=Proteiniborus sp. MB09-C3 TaxID=3050072 RepID=UPI0025541918|nr:ABC-2 family transporter protein [Proteiniborus sp. MB09-C3]WIV11781.1 ABC-2 family transporter protein [Proteiniborus sp. MB09-C3]
MKKVNKYFYITKISLSNNFVYFGDFLIRNFFFLFIIYIYMMLWTNIYGSKGGNVAGLTLNQMIWYLVVTEIVTLSRSNIFMEATQDVKNGNIAYMLNKPYNYILYCFSNSLGEMGIKLLNNTIMGFIIGILCVGPLKNFSLIHLPFIIISILIGIFINFFIHISLSLTSFWLEENSAFFWIYNKLVFTLGGMLMPLELFPKWLRSIAINLPFAYVTYAPAKLAVNFSYSGFIYTIAFQLVYLGFFFILSMIIFRKGARALNVNGG